MGIINEIITKEPKFGDVFIVKFDGVGTEQSGVRPGVVFQNNTGNKNSPNVIMFPLTSSIKKINMPTHVLIKSEDTDLVKDSLVLCENPETVSKFKIGKYITTLSNEYMKKISIASIVATSALSLIDSVEFDVIKNKYKDIFGNV